MVWKIVEDYEILHYDRCPILFTGTNSEGNRIIGSLVEEAPDFAHFWFVLPTPEIYSQYRQGLMTYRDVILHSTEVFTVTEIGGTSTSESWSPADLPADCMPAIDSFCPV